MANNCITGISVTAFDDECGERLYNVLASAKKDAEKKREGIFIGCGERYLFDAEFFRDRDTVLIFGWVKWGFSDSEVRDFIAWLTVQTGIREVCIAYDEPGYLLYGNYSYADGKLTHRRLPEDCYPEDDGDRDFGITLESAMRKHGVTEEIPMN